jgi:uncharacterized protein (TIGR02246 family)
VRRIAFPLIAFVFVSFICGPRAEPKSLESDLQIVLKQFITAWDKSDSVGIAALFEGNADLVIPDGLLIEGRDAVQKFYASTFERGYSGSHGSASIKHTRQISPDMAIVDGEWRIDGAVIDGRAEAAEVGIFSLVAKHRSEGWAISSLREQSSARNLTRFTDIRPPAQGEQSKSGADSEKTDATDSRERNAIKELERKDITASKKNDVDALVALWTDDGVLLQPGAAPVVGKEAIRNLLLQEQQQAAQVQTLAYDEKWNEVRVAGGYAFEWGQISATLKLPNTQEVQQSVNAIRVLARQPDGSWRVARVAITPAARR